MPFVQLPSHDDYVSIWYITNSAYGNVGSFDPEKPTVVILHPLFLDSSWLNEHFDDPRLSAEYNLIAFDQRTQGRSQCRPSALHDCYVDAADLASAIQALCLSPAHFLAFACISVNSVVRLTALWPELVLSLTLCSVPPPTELKWVLNAYDELLQLWCYAEDLDSFEHAGSELATFMTGEVKAHALVGGAVSELYQQNDNIDLRDSLIAYWEKITPPAKRLRIVEFINILRNRTKISKKELARITCPVFIIQNERSPVSPLVHAESLRDDIRDVTGEEPRLYVVRGAKACMSITPGCASLTNRVFTGFLSQLPRSRSDLRPPAIPTLERTRKALKTLSELIGDPSIAHRNPKSLLSFSCVTQEVAKGQLESLRFYSKDIDKTYCPLGRDGRPIRKFSERIQAHHWFHGDHWGMSHVGKRVHGTFFRHGVNLITFIDPEILLISAQQNTRPSSPEWPLDSSLIVNGTDLLTESVKQEHRLRKATMNSISAEKQLKVLKVATQGISFKANLPAGMIPLPKGVI